MCVIPVPKAITFGEPHEWQTSPQFIRAVVTKAREQGMEDVYDEMVDDIAIVLAQMGHILLSA